jgi:ABC-type cobalamin/Fe3+-siderophores transport system ATPase subunit
MSPLIAATGLRAGYATGDVLQDVSIEVGTSEIVGVLGRNGVGKTTLMRALIGLISVRRGSIFYRGGDITRQPANRPPRSESATCRKGAKSSRICRSWIICAWGNSSIARANSNPTKSMVISPFCGTGLASAPAR